jgi:hypothetical protein
MAMFSPSGSGPRIDEPFKPLFLAVEQLFKRRPELECVETKRRERGKIEMHSPLFYVACTVGGMLSCGLTHMAITPLDLVKCNMQVSFYFFVKGFCLPTLPILYFCLLKDSFLKKGR